MFVQCFIFGVGKVPLIHVAAKILFRADAKWPRIHDVLGMAKYDSVDIVTKGFRSNSSKTGQPVLKLKSALNYNMT
jgi:hypothetical protein